MKNHIVFRGIKFDSQEKSIKYCQELEKLKVKYQLLDKEVDIIDPGEFATYDQLYELADSFK
jgi:hypothetical protein